MSRIILLLICAMPTLHAGSGETGFAFLKIGAGARTAGMGEAAIATTSDATAAYWNPGALSVSGDRQITVAYNNWIAGVRHHFVAARFGPSWAVHFISTGVDGIEQREIPSEDPTARFSSHHIALGVTHARQWSSEWHGGVTLKWVHERIQESVNAVAVDAGILYKPARFTRATFAFTASNLGRSDKLIDQRITLPATFRLGMSYKLIDGGAHVWTMAGDMVQTLHTAPKWHTGTEWAYKERVFLRAGYQANYSARGFSAGSGLKWNAVEVDYSVSFFGRGLGQAHRWSAGFRF